METPDVSTFTEIKEIAILNEEEVSKKKLHRILRTLFIIFWMIFSLSIILFLFYQNGKSLYDQGN